LAQAKGRSAECASGGDYQEEVGEISVDWTNKDGLLVIFVDRYLLSCTVPHMTTVFRCGTERVLCGKRALVNGESRRVPPRYFMLPAQ
jgi:hypothetical protein